MGLLAGVCGTVHPAAGWTFKLGKLAVRLWQTGPRPVKLIEKTVVFVVGCVNGRVTLCYYAVKIVAGKVINSRRANATFEVVTAVETRPGDVLIGRQQLEAALAQAATSQQQQPRGQQQQEQGGPKALTPRQEAAVWFAVDVLERGRLSSGGLDSVSAAWLVALPGSKAGAAFDVVGLKACFKSFFSTDSAWRMTREVRRARKTQEGDKEKATPASLRSALSPLAEGALLEIKHALRDDAIDLFLL